MKVPAFVVLSVGLRKKGKKNMNSECLVCGSIYDCSCASEETTKKETMRKARQRKATLTRRAREQALGDLGLVKVRGADSGRTYWE